VGAVADHAQAQLADQIGTPRQKVDERPAQEGLVLDRLHAADGADDQRRLLIPCDRMKALDIDTVVDLYDLVRRNADIVDEIALEVP
jgi:hypothetical protein